MISSLFLSEFVAVGLRKRVALAGGLLVALGLATGAAGAEDNFVRPSMPTCPAGAVMLLSGAGGCFALNGALKADYVPGEEEAAVGLKAGRMQVVGSANAGPMKISGDVTLNRPADRWILPAGLSAVDPSVFSGGDSIWATSANETRIVRAYLSAGTSNLFVTMGRVSTTLANTSDDAPFGDPALYGGGAGVGLALKPTLKGMSTQVLSKLGSAHTLGFGIEGIDGDGAGTAVASWSYKASGRSGHVTLTEPDAIAGAFSRLKMHSGLTVDAAPFRLRTALAGDATGWLDGMASALASAGMFKFDASSSYRRASMSAEDNALYGFGLGARADLNDNLAFDGGVGWAYDAAADETKARYKFVTELSGLLAERLKVAWGIGLQGTGATLGATRMQYFGSAKLEWSPEEDGAVTAEFRRNANDTYKLTATAARSFN